MSDKVEPEKLNKLVPGKVICQPNDYLPQRKVMRKKRKQRDLSQNINIDVLAQSV